MPHTCFVLVSTLEKRFLCLFAGEVVFETQSSSCDVFCLALKRSTPLQLRQSWDQFNRLFVGAADVSLRTHLWWELGLSSDYALLPGGLKKRLHARTLGRSRPKPWTFDTLELAWCEVFHQLSIRMAAQNGCVSVCDVPRFGILKIRYHITTPQTSCADLERKTSRGTERFVNCVFLIPPNMVSARSCLRSSDLKSANVS